MSEFVALAHCTGKNKQSIWKPRKPNVDSIEISEGVERDYVCLQSPHLMPFSEKLSRAEPLACSFAPDSQASAVLAAQHTRIEPYICGMKPSRL